MTVRRPDQVVEVFAPSGAAHLARIADEIAGRLSKEIGSLPPEALRRLLRAGAEIEQERQEFEQFKERIRAKPTE